MVITGLGPVSSLGIGWKEFWENLIKGKSGITKLSAFDTSPYDIHFAGEVKKFDPKEFISAQRISQLGKASQMAIAACQLALKDANINLRNLSKYKMGLTVGTTLGESQVIEQIVKGNIYPAKLNAKRKRALIYPANIISSHIAQEFRLTGHNILFANACAAGNYAVGYAFDLIKTGQLDYALAGGVDAISRLAFTGFGRLYAMAPEKCQPFDKNRKGMMLGEGAAFLLLENLESAEKRKARIYAEIINYGLSCDAYHMTEPNINGIIQCINRTLQASNIKLEEINYINAHGTGTIENDRAECQAFNRVFGKLLKSIPVSSIKSMLGHTMGAAAAFETMVCCLVINEMEIPPTINFQELDLQCEIDCVPNKSRKKEVTIVMNSSQAFGGNNATLLIKRLIQNRRKA